MDNGAKFDISAGEIGENIQLTINEFSTLHKKNGEKNNPITISLERSSYCKAIGSNEAFVVNSDREHRYRVTVEIRSRQGIDEGTTEIVVLVFAGSKRSVGCTIIDQYFPHIICHYSIKGQEQL